MQDLVLTPIVMGVARHLITTAGGFIFAKSCDLASFCVSGDTQGQIIGAALAAVGVAWSVVAKRAGVQ